MDLFGDIIEEEEEESVFDETPPVPPQEGLRPPREMEFCRGHEVAEGQLLALYKTGKMPHGLIFTGPEGIGKATFAFRFARFLLKNPGADAQNMDVGPEDNVFRLVASGGHPDIFTAGRVYDATRDRYKDSVEVDEIRKVAPFLRKTASYGGWRVVVIDDADTMNRNAQNALLKILEEPPPKTVLILVTHRLGALIPTIRSRAHVVHFESLSPEIVADLLYFGGFDGVEDLALLTGGSMSKAEIYAREDAAEMLEEILGLLGNKPDWIKIHALAERMGRGKDKSYRIFEELFLWLYRQGAKTKARGQSLPSVLESAAAFFQKQSLEHIVGTGDALEVLFETTDRSNLDKRQAVLQAFSLIAA